MLVILHYVGMYVCVRMCGVCVCVCVCLRVVIFQNRVNSLSLLHKKVDKSVYI